MTLYRITTGRYGESYERCYVWAATAERAIELFAQSHPGVAIGILVSLFSTDTHEFITKLSDSGFDFEVDR